MRRIGNAKLKRSATAGCCFQPAPAIKGASHRLPRQARGLEGGDPIDLLPHASGAKGLLDIRRFQDRAQRICISREPTDRIDQVGAVCRGIRRQRPGCAPDSRPQRRTRMTQRPSHPYPSEEQLDAVVIAETDPLRQCSAVLSATATLFAVLVDWDQGSERTKRALHATLRHYPADVRVH